MEINKWLVNWFVRNTPKRLPTKCERTHDAANFVLISLMEKWQAATNLITNFRKFNFKFSCEIFTSNVLYLQSRLIPTAKHFLNRQYWHRFRFNRITKHFPSRKHRYSICFWMLRRKKPCRKCQMQKVIIVLSLVRANTNTQARVDPPEKSMVHLSFFGKKNKSERTYFASFTWRHAVVIARRLVSAYLARYNRFRWCVRIGSGKLLIWNGTRNERCDLCAISCASEKKK